ncbi:heme-binding domain-containing protein [Tenacibaculum sp. UWU-22]|uniref:heme-binding domain-containing protein n=1 Tax=Tenacibaculum sp. UWU-22 TaxID=3234187 RepID=UPI0034DB6B25
MKNFKRVTGILILVLIIAQFFHPKKNEGDMSSIESFITETNAPDAVHTILKKACFDCHSNKTRYPWYNNITPVNFVIANHVNEGKEELNFSDWVTYSSKRKAHKIEKIREEVEKRKMPLSSYTLIHTDARLTEQEVQQIVDWTKSVENNYKN